MAKAHKNGGPKKDKQADEMVRIFEQIGKAKKVWGKLAPVQQGGDIDVVLIDKLQAMMPPGIYRHYKGGLDVVEGIIFDINGAIPPVVPYTELQGDLAGKTGFRSLYDHAASFWQPVEKPDQPSRRRFGLVRQLTTAQIGKVKGSALRISRLKDDAARLQFIKGLLRP